MSVSEELLEILVCPACRAGLEERGENLVCVGCGLHYPVRDGIPYLRPEDGYRPEEADSA